MSLFDFDPAPLATALLNSLWQGVLLAAVVFAVLHVLDKRRPLNAATRYVVHMALLLVLVALPFAPQPHETPAPPPLPVLAETVLPEPIPVSPRAAAPTPERTAKVPLEAPSLPILAEPPSRSWQVPAVLTQGMAWVVGIWLLIAGGLLVRVGRSVRAVWRLKQESVPLPPHYQQRLTGWQRRYGVRRRVKLLGTDALETPVATGYLRPAILLPFPLLDALTDAECEQVVLHELAHLHRRDDWTNLFQKIAQAVFFFHPAVHLVARALDRTREVACDDWVVARTQQPHAYASCLTRLVELDVQQRGLSLAPGMAAQHTHLFARVQRLLAQGRRATTRLSRANLLLVGLLLLAAYLLLARVAPGFAPPAPATPVPVVVAELPREALPRARVSVQEASLPGNAALTGNTAPPAERDHVAPEPTRLAEPPRPSTVPAARPPLSEPATALADLPPLPLAEPERRTLPVMPPAREDGTARQGAGNTAPPGLSALSWKRVLRASAGIATSNDKGLFLREAAPRLPADAGVFAAYIAAANTIVSPSERRRALTALIDHQQLEGATLRLLIKAARDLVSSSEKGQVLRRIARVLPDEADLHDAYRRAAETIASPSEYRRVMNALR